ncbi:Hypothetical protein, putative [Bodo saltans]|uniref:Membrane-associated protein n=1 Tax=Bodo saltans TaxID=75058 RepID=A0A0S4JNB0_BODSA|nr:Hypothetical protein, putative [Bodo saltans]|eukprot:CUG90760.1 Hypothetical protein, putative [Bodo saltans]
MSCRQAIAVIAVLGLLLGAVHADVCSSQPDCSACVAENLCGWCSVPVTYQDNSTGAQCAGFGSGARPFICNGVYSTEVCQRGYVCDVSSGSCDLGAPGAGNTLAECEQICHKSNTNVYLCDQTTKACNVVPDGTPGSTSLEICQAVCNHIPTRQHPPLALPHPLMLATPPATPAPQPPPAMVRPSLCANRSAAPTTLSTSAITKMALAPPSRP